MFWADDEELDLSVRYALTEQLQLYFDAVNLTDGPGRRFSETENRVIENETFGERYIVGVRFNF